MLIHMIFAIVTMYPFRAVMFIQQDAVRKTTTVGEKMLIAHSPFHERVFSLVKSFNKA